MEMENNSKSINNSLPRDLEKSQFMKNIKNKLANNSCLENIKNEKFTYENNDINLNDLKKMKEKLTNLSPTEIIEDILKTHRNNSNSIKHNLNEYNQNFLENLKRNEISNYIQANKERSVKDIISDFENRIENYNVKTKLFCIEKEKENKEFQSQMSLFRTKNLELDSKITELELENKELTKKLKESQDMIQKLQAKFTIFDKIKPTLEEFFKEYPYQSPSEIITDIKEKREATIKILEDLNSMRERVFKTEKEKKEIRDLNNKTIEDLSGKIYEMELKRRTEIEKYLNEINHLNSELNSYKIYKEDNIKLHNMLYSLYNKLISRLSLDKNIKIDPKFILSEKDFQPNLFDNEEIARYITLMLNNSDETKSSKMFRETSAYANLMLRISQKDIKSRFDPVNTFKEIKKELENANDEKNQYRQDLNILKDKIKNYEAELKKLKNELKYKNLQYENLEEKFNKKFQERLEKQKEVKNFEIINRNHSRLMSARNLRSVISTNKIEKDSIESDENKLFLNGPNNSREKNKRNSNTFSQIFITDDKMTKSTKNFNTNDNRRNQNLEGKAENIIQVNNIRNVKSAKSANGRLFAGRRLYLRPSTSCNLNKYAKHFNLDGMHLNQLDKNRKGNNTDSSCYSENVDNKNKVKYSSSNSKSYKLKKMKLSKNKDKLVKADPYISVSKDALNSLVQHTNNLFLYRAKMKNVLSNQKENTNYNTNIFSRFRDTLDKNFAKLNKMNKKKKQVGIGDRIIDNIDNMIKSLEK